MTPELRHWAWGRALSPAERNITVPAAGGGRWVFFRRPWPERFAKELRGALQIGVELGPDGELGRVLTTRETNLHRLCLRLAEERRVERFEAALEAYRLRTGDRFLRGAEHDALLEEIGYERRRHVDDEDDS
jgi:hypothetical protein